MKEVVCQFDDYVFAALQNAAERLGNTIEHVIEFAVIEAVTGRNTGDHIEEQTEDFSPPVNRAGELYTSRPGRTYGRNEDIAEEAYRRNKSDFLPF